MQKQRGLKRDKERARQQKQRDKADRAANRKDKDPRQAVTPGEDPDIAGIVPGPQPPAID